MASRRATHSGSWYTDSARELNSQLADWLYQVNPSHSPAKAIISPHAGYSYCGSCAAYSYKQIDPNQVKRIFILGPSHHVRLSGCALSPNAIYKTPLYDLAIDQDVYCELKNTGEFDTMSRATDENEHSIEMQLPYIAKVMEKHQNQFTIIPVLVGSLNVEKEVTYGRIFAPYLMEPNNLFIISSDFCHWGKRFRFTYYDRKFAQISESIENLDKMAMEIIEGGDPMAFADYLREYQNTICGRHPIGVLLNAIDTIAKSGINGHKMNLRFLNYAQSSQCNSLNDSSVSYAAAALKITCS